MMKKDLFDIIKSKSYDELTEVERLEVAELAEDAVAYDNLKKFMLDVDSIAVNDFQPSGRVKTELNDLFDQVHGQRRYAWYMSFAAVIVPKEKPLHKQPLFYAAAVLLLALLVVPISNLKLGDSANMMAQQEVVEEEIVPTLEKEEFNESEVAISTDVVTRSDNNEANAEVIMEEGARVPMEESFALKEAENMEDEITVFSLNAAPMSVTSVPATTGSSHPDGVFDNWAQESNFSIPASKQPELLDLLTATF